MTPNTLKWIGMDASSAVTDYLDAKLGSLDKFLSHIPLPHDIHIECIKTTRHHQKGEIFACEAHLRLPKRTLMATAQANDIYAAIDRLKDELERQLTKYKELPASKARRQQGE